MSTSLLKRINYLISLLILVFTPLANAMMIAPGDDDTSCDKILVVFARGSGQNDTQTYKGPDPSLNEIYQQAGVNSDEKQTAKFFEEFHKRIPTGVKYVSLHNSTQPTGQHYNQYGYAAVTAFDAIHGPFNTLSKKPLHRKDVSNRYYESVKDGAEELAWYLEDQLTSCPLQQVVLGGYSQGAEVVADGINIMQPAFRPRIADVALYGDPKFNPREDGSYVKGPWVRGNAKLPNLSGGILSPRKQYVPQEVPNLESWCASGDKICDAGIRDSRTILTSASDPLRLQSPTENITHSYAYQDTWIGQSMNEIVKLTRDRIPDIDTTTNVYINKKDKLWNLDMAVVIDNTSSMADALKTVKGSTEGLSTKLLNSYWNSRVGIVTYGGLPSGYNDPSYQYSSVITPFTNDETTVKEGFQSITAQEPYYGLLTDGTPYMLNEQSAQLDGIMTAIQGLQWEHGAQKKIIVITNNPTAPRDPSGHNWTPDQVKQAAFNLDPAGLNLANVSCDETWNCDYSIDEAFQQLNGDGPGETSDVNLSFGTIDDLTMLLDDMSVQPVAKLTGDTNGYVNFPMQLNANESYSPYGPLVEYDWDCNGDGQTDAVTSSPTNNCIYTEPGDYVAAIRVVNENNQSTQAVWPVHLSAGAPPVASTAPDTPDAALTYSENSMNLSWSNTYDSDVYIQVSDERDNLIGYAPADAKSVTLAGIGSEVPELHVSACTDDGDCSSPAILSLDHDKLGAMIVGDDADTFVVPTTAPISVTPAPTQEAPNNTPGSNNQQTTSTDAQKTDVSPSILPATTVDFLTSAPNSVLGDTAPTSVAQQFTHHAITATSTSKPYIKAMGSKWKPLVLFGGGLLLIAALFRFFWLQKATR